MTITTTDRPAALSEWRESAACRGRAALMDPPPPRWDDDQNAVDVRRAALALCTTCPVLDACREWVLGLPDADDPGGVCAGMTVAERTDGREHRARVAAAGPGTRTCPGCDRDRPRWHFIARHSYAVAKTCQTCRERKEQSRGKGGTLRGAERAAARLGITPEQLADTTTALRAARQAAYLTQPYVAGRIGVSAPTLAGWELGRSWPTADYLAVWAGVLGVPLPAGVAGAMADELERAAG
jgi:DNA-binding XRE family transcriptional regulator